MFRRFLLRLYPGLLSTLVVLAILWLTLAPHPLPDDDIPMFENADKVVHALMFGGLVFALVFDRELLGVRRWLRGAVRASIGDRWLLIVFAVGSSAFGGVIELLQGAMGLGRGCDPWDFVADAVGAVVFAVISPWIVRRLLGRSL